MARISNKSRKAFIVRFSKDRKVAAAQRKMVNDAARAAGFDSVNAWIVNVLHRAAMKVLDTKEVRFR